MKVSKKLYALFLAAFVVAVINGCEVSQSEALSAIGAVSGQVVDGDGNPVSSALITVEGSSYAAMTNSDGYYVLNLVAGTFTLMAAKQGFQTMTKSVTIEANEEGAMASPVSLNFELAYDDETEDFQFERRRHRREEPFDRGHFDQNGDGNVGPDEFPCPPPIFSDIDADGDGYISEEEFETFRLAHTPSE